MPNNKLQNYKFQGETHFEVDHLDSQDQLFLKYGQLRFLGT